MRPERPKLTIITEDGTPQTIRAVDSQHTTEVFQDDAETFFVKSNQDPQRIVIEYIASRAMEELYQTVNQTGVRTPSPVLCQSPSHGTVLRTQNLKPEEESEWNPVEETGALFLANNQNELIATLVLRYLLQDADANGYNMEYNQSTKTLLSLDYGQAFVSLLSLDSSESPKQLPVWFLQPQSIEELVAGILFTPVCVNGYNTRDYYDDHSILQGPSIECKTPQKKLEIASTVWDMLHTLKDVNIGEILSQTQREVNKQAQTEEVEECIAPEDDITQHSISHIFAQARNLLRPRFNLLTKLDKLDINVFNEVYMRFALDYGHTKEKSKEISQAWTTALHDAMTRQEAFETELSEEEDEEGSLFVIPQAIKPPSSVTDRTFPGTFTSSNTRTQHADSSSFRVQDELK